MSVHPLQRCATNRCDARGHALRAPRQQFLIEKQSHARVLVSFIVFVGRGLLASSRNRLVKAFAETNSSVCQRLKSPSAVTRLPLLLPTFLSQLVSASGDPSRMFETFCRKLWRGRSNMHTDRSCLSLGTSGLFVPLVMVTTLPRDGSHRIASMTA